MWSKREQASMENISFFHLSDVAYDNEVFT